MLKVFFTSISFLFITNCYTQIHTQFGSRLKFVNQNFHYKSSSDNYPISYSHRDSKIKYPAFELIGRSTSYSSQDDSTRFKVNYTLEVGLLFFKLDEKRVSVPSNPDWVSDTIGTYYTRTAKGTKLEISNFIDFTFLISDKYTLISSIGLKIESRDGIKKSDNEYGYLLDNYEHNDPFESKRKYVPYSNLYQSSKTFPLTFKLLLSPQLIIKYDRLSLNVNITQDVFIINNLFEDLIIGKLNLSTYTGIGLFIIPHFEKKIDESELLKEDFDY